MLRTSSTEALNSYANENSKLISVTLDEDKGTKRAIVTIVLLFLLFFAIPVLLLVLNVTKSIKLPVVHEKVAKYRV